MNRIRVARVVIYEVVCGDCGATLGGPYTSYDEARKQVPVFQVCDHRPEAHDA